MMRVEPYGSVAEAVAAELMCETEVDVERVHDWGATFAWADVIAMVATITRPEGTLWATTEEID